MNLIKETAYIQYAANKARTENAMKKLTESGNTLTEEQINEILMEGFNFQEVVNKIKTIFSTMTNKFVEFTKKQIQNKHDAAYLNAIKGKITQIAKGKNIPIEMRDYWVGTDNIRNVSNILNKFDATMYDKVKADDKDTCTLNIQKLLFSDFNPQNIKFDQYCLNYFQGGAAVKKTNVNALPFDKIITWCIDFPKILDAAKADADKNSALVSKAIEAASAKAQPANAATQTAPAQTQPAAQGQTTAQTDSADYSKADLRYLAYQFKSILEDAFDEANDNTSNTPPQQTPQNPAPAQSTPPAKSTNPADGKPDDQKTGSTMKIDTKAADASNAQDTGVSVFASSVQSVAVSIMNARLRSVNIIYNDYIKLLQTVCPRAQYVNPQGQAVQQQPQQNPAPAQPNAQG